ncbi:MAG: hypothetical protein O2782_21555 [bacterium]|nr:hypothetical protein [bacterium]
MESRMRDRSCIVSSMAVVAALLYVAVLTGCGAVGVRSKVLSQDREFDPYRHLCVDVVEVADDVTVDDTTRTYLRQQLVSEFTAARLFESVSTEPPADGTRYLDLRTRITTLHDGSNGGRWFAALIGSWAPIGAAYLVTQADFHDSEYAHIIAASSQVIASKVVPGAVDRRKMAEKVAQETVKFARKKGFAHD